MKNKWHHAKVLLKRFHLNAHTIELHRQTQKLELRYMSPYRIYSESERVKKWKNAGSL